MQVCWVSWSFKKDVCILGNFTASFEVWKVLFLQNKRQINAQVDAAS